MRAHTLYFKGFHRTWECGGGGGKEEEEPPPPPQWSGRN
jgi:hypothetical protein